MVLLGNEIKGVHKLFGFFWGIQWTDSVVLWNGMADSHGSFFVIWRVLEVSVVVRYFYWELHGRLHCGSVVLGDNIQGFSVAGRCGEKSLQVLLGCGRWALCNWRL